MFQVRKTPGNPARMRAAAVTFTALPKNSLCEIPMARKLNLSLHNSPLARIKGTAHETRKVGYKTKYRYCKNPECQKLAKFTRSDQIYCDDSCRQRAARLRREQRDITKYYAKTGKKPPGVISYRDCINPNCRKTYPARHNNAKYCSTLCYQVMTRANKRAEYRKLNPLPEPPAKPIAPHTAGECITAGYTGDV